VDRYCEELRLVRATRHDRLHPHRRTPSDTLARNHERRQVSWLAGLRSKTAFPEHCSSGVSVFDSPLTVAGAAAELRDARSPHSLLIPFGNRR